MNYRIRRPNGGYLLHAIPEGSNTALCGYAPSSPNGYLIRHRGRWIMSAHNKPTCKRCLAKLQQIEENDE